MSFLYWLFYSVMYHCYENITLCNSTAHTVCGHHAVNITLHTFCGHHVVNITLRTCCGHHAVNITLRTCCGHHAVNITLRTCCGHHAVNITLHTFCGHHAVNIYIWSRSYLLKKGCLFCCDCHSVYSFILKVLQIIITFFPLSVIMLKVCYSRHLLLHV